MKNKHEHVTKHIFITGGVVSSLGKGLTAASIGLLLGRRGYRVKMQKLEPYLNVDTSSMSPYQHGEIYVTEDGAETDLDLGHYERIAGVICHRESNYTTGQIYSAVINRERAGGYNGKTVQVIPHITDEIKSVIRSQDAPDVDVVITEIGGTAGDIESLPFLEAIRQYRQAIGRKNGLFIHLTLLPYIKAAGEMKTKPSQQSVGILRTIGIIPDILICRCERSMSEEHREKLALFCNVQPEMVVEEKDVEHSIYEVPVALADQGLDVSILEMLELPVRPLELNDWKQMLVTQLMPKNGAVDIAVIAESVEAQDTYKSIHEALQHAALGNDLRVNLHSIEAKILSSQEDAAHHLRGMHGVIVPGSLGDQELTGRMQAVQYARLQDLPCFAISLGMQCILLEFARNVCGLPNAGSTEFDPKTRHPLIDVLDGKHPAKNKNGATRLGASACRLKPGTRAAAAYGQVSISERYRQKYGFNLKYRARIEEGGMVISGTSPDKGMVEIIELPQHAWFIGCQFHPEFQSTPLRSHPLFKGFIAAARVCRDQT